MLRVPPLARHRGNIAGEIPDFDVSPFVPHEHRKSIKVMNRPTRFAVGAASLAAQDSGLDLPNEQPERIGVVMGTGVVPVDMAELTPALVEASNEAGQLQIDQLGKNGSDALVPLWILKYLPNMVAAHVSMVLNAQGPNSTITTACVAGTQAIGEAFRLIQRGDADVVFSGGADSRIDPIMLLAYTKLGTLSRADRPPHEVSRPFDRTRDGFVLGEGAGVLVLEEYDRAKARGATIYAEVLGFGSSFDAYSLTKPDPEAKGAARAIEAALNEAHVDRYDVDYINAHGTSTPINDPTETRGVKTLFGEHAYKLAMSSTKSMTGHLLGAAGGLEAGITALAVYEQIAPPTINLDHPDENCDLDYVAHKSRPLEIEYALSNSFGFGGTNAALLFKRFHG
jgi:3-oxoacyl-[acyl-carrier-protein] synthase II